MFKNLYDFTQIGDKRDDLHLIPILATDQGTCFVNFPNPFPPTLRLMCTGSYPHKLPHDQLDKFLTILALNFDKMTNDVATLVGYQAFVASSKCMASIEKNSGTG